MFVVPFNRCHDALQYTLSSSLFACCNSSAVSLSGSRTRRSRSSLGFSNPFLDYKYTSFCRSLKVFRPTLTEQNSFVRLGLAIFFFFGRGKQAESLPS